MKSQPATQSAALGTVGFCAGGGNVWDLAVSSPDLVAAVVFYGAPPAPIDQLDNLVAPVLGNYAELDRTLTSRTPDIITGMLTRTKPFELHISHGVNHTFPDDTG